jgi:protein tyrosine phosphatase (PTP) superfamily phosphohydrolase (DUF442 family)
MLNLFYSCLITLLFVCCSRALAQDESRMLMLVLNMNNTAELPKNFRLCSELNASASGQFSEKGLLAMLLKIPCQDIVMIDLRQESHGFVNGMAVSWRDKNDWFNKDRSIENVELDQQQRLSYLLRYGSAIIHEKEQPDNIYEIVVDKVSTEADLVRSIGLRYLHIPVTDHLTPTDAAVDTFVEFVNTLPEGFWFHFHCAAGRGRSSTFFIMYDMLKNAQNLTLEEIFSRQHQLGGVNFNVAPNPNSWKYPYQLANIEFLKQFYSYCLEGHHNVKWSEWNELD